MAASEPRPSAAQSLPRRFLFNVNFVFLFALTSNTTGFGVAILLARALNPEGRGDMALFQAAVGIGVAFANLGVGSAVFYFVSRREFEGRQAMEVGLTVTLITAAAAVLAVLIVAAFFESELAAEGVNIPYGMAILAAPAFIQLRVAEGLLRAQGRFGAMNALEVSLPFCMIASVGGTELLWGLTVPRAVIAWTLAFLPPIVAGYVLLGREVWPHRPAGWPLLTKAVHFGGQSALTNLVQLANYRVDTFLILALVSRSGVGIYTVANSQVEGLLILANSVAIVLLTNITAGDKANAARLTPVVCRNTLLVTTVAAVVAGLIADLWIPEVFGSKYQASVEPYLWLLPGMVAISGAKILAAYVFSRGLPIVNFWIAVANLAITTPVTVALLALWGVPGAAIGTSFGYVLMLAMTAYAYARISGNAIFDALMPRRSDVRLYTDAVVNFVRRLRGLPVPPAQTPLPSEGEP